MKRVHQFLLAAAAFGAMASSAPAGAQRVMIGIGRGWYPWHERVTSTPGLYGPVWYGDPGPHYGWYGWHGGYYRQCGWRGWGYHRRVWRCW